MESTYKYACAPDVESQSAIKVTVTRASIAAPDLYLSSCTCNDWKCDHELSTRMRIYGSSREKPCEDSKNYNRSSGRGHRRSRPMAPHKSVCKKAARGRFALSSCERGL